MARLNLWTRDELNQRIHRDLWIEQIRRDYEEYLGEVQKKAPPIPPLTESEGMERLVNSWMVGCDPEFVILNAKGEVVNTRDTFPHEGIVGWDHSGHVQEIRPEPTKGTYALVKRIQQIILSNPELAKMRSHRFRAGAALRAKLTVRDSLANDRGERLLTLGGHVHYDRPCKRKDDPEQKNVIDAADRMTEWLEALDILPLNESTVRRNDPAARRQGYGQFGDFRAAGRRAESDEGRLEYRVMASWLYHPWTAFMCLTGAKLAAAAPRVVLDTLPKNVHSYKGLKELFELFKGKDVNARRIVENLLSRPVKELQKDPSVDFKETWRELDL